MKTCSPTILSLAISTALGWPVTTAAQSIITTETDVIVADAGTVVASPRAFAFTGTPDMLHDADWSRFMSHEMGDGGKVVKDAPYSAEAISETTQYLADGNKISRKTVTMLYRDAQGRTRQEQTAPGSTIFLNDPVSGRRTVLNVEKKTATVLPNFDYPLGKLDINRFTEMGKAGKAQIIRRGAEGETRIVEKSSDGETQIISEPGRQIIIKRREVDRGDSTKKIEENKEVRISVVRTHGGEDAVAIAGLPLDIDGLMALRSGKHKGVTTSLGMKDIQGVKAEGSQTITTIPAGEIGNEKPIQIISEKWYSPDLQAVVYSRQSDPRSGETIYKLNNIRRVAQPAELFAIPAGYQIKERPTPPMPPLSPLPPSGTAAPLAPLPPAPPAAVAPPAAPR